MRNFTIHSSLLDTLAPLYQHAAKCVRLSMLRLFRTMISTKDDVFIRYVIKRDLFVHVFMLIRVSQRDNILNAALLELFNYIGTQSLKPIISYLLDVHKTEIISGPFSHTQPFKALLAKLPTNDSMDEAINYPYYGLALTC